MIPNLHMDAGELDADSVLGRLSETGLVFFDGANTALVSRLARELGAIVPHPDACAEGVTALDFDGKRKPRRPGEKGFSSEELYPHTDRSILPSPPSLLILWCERNSPYGGQSVFVDGQWLHKRLQRSHPADLEALERPENFIFKYNDQLANHAIFQRLPSGRRRIRFRRDEFLFATPAAVRPLERLLDLIDRSVLNLTLSPGQGYIVQNTRWLHGRTTFLGRRSFRRVLVDAHAQDGGLLEGFEPASPEVERLALLDSLPQVLETTP